MIVRLQQKAVPPPLAPTSDVNTAYTADDRQDDINQSIEALIGDPEVDLLYRDAKYLRDQIDLQQVNASTVKHLRNHLSEYLSHFVVMGYDIHGRRIFIQHTPRQQHIDALQKYGENVIHSNLIQITGATQTREIIEHDVDKDLDGDNDDDDD